MKQVSVEVLKTRNYIGLGFRYAGNVMTNVDKNIAVQLENQGFVKIVKEKESLLKSNNGEGAGK